MNKNGTQITVNETRLFCMRFFEVHYLKKVKTYQMYNTNISLFLCVYGILLKTDRNGQWWRFC